VGMVSGEFRARRGNIFRKEPIALCTTDFMCVVNRSLESNIRPRYLTSLDQGIKAFWHCRGFGIKGRRFVNNMSSVLVIFA